MAFCPSCNAPMGARDVRCEACGYEFPPELDKGRFAGLEYSGFADGILMLAAVILGVGSAVALIYWFWLLVLGIFTGFGLWNSLHNGFWMTFGVYLPLSLISQVSSVIVLLRARHVKPDLNKFD
jgi:hypothetical protein